MAEKKESTAWLWWTLGVFAFLGLGAGTFFYLKKKGIIGKKEEGGGEEKSNEGTSEISLNTGTTTYTPSSGGGGGEGATPFKNKQEGNVFRAWVRSVYPQYAKDIELSETGDYDNSYIRKAWAKYGQEWLKESERMRNTPQGSGSGGGKGANEEGWTFIKKMLYNFLSKDYNNSNDYEQTFYMIDKPYSIADWVVHLKQDGSLYYGEQTYNEDKKQQWGKWGYFVKGDGTSYWAVEMGNGKGNGTWSDIVPLLKSVFEAQYPDVVKEYKDKGIWKNFSNADGYDFDGALRGEQGKYIDPMDSLM